MYGSASIINKQIRDHMKKVIVVILSLAFQAVVFAAEPKTVSFTFEDNQKPVTYDYQNVEKIMKTSKTIQSMIGDTAGDTSPIPLFISKKSFDTLVELSQRPSHNFKQHVRDIVFADKSESLTLENTITELTDLAALLDAADFLDFDSNNSVAESIYSLMKSYSAFFSSTTDAYSFLSNKTLFNRLAAIKNKLFMHPFTSRLISKSDAEMWDFLTEITEVPYRMRSFSGKNLKSVCYDSQGALLGVTFKDNRIVVTNLDTDQQKYNQALGLQPEDAIIGAHLLNQGSFLALVIYKAEIFRRAVSGGRKTIILYDLTQQQIVSSFDLSAITIDDIRLINNGQTLYVVDNTAGQFTRFTFSPGLYEVKTSPKFFFSQVGDTQERHSIYRDDRGLQYTKDDKLLKKEHEIINTRLNLKWPYLNLLAYDSEKDLIAAGSTKTNKLYLIFPEKLWIHQTTIPVANLSKIMFNPQGTKLTGVTQDHRTIIEWDISQLVNQMNSTLSLEQLLLLVTAHYLYKQAALRTDSHLRINLYKYPHLKKIYDTLPERIREQSVGWFDWDDTSTSHESSPLQLEEQEHEFTAVPVHTHADEDESSKNVGWMSWFKRFFKKK